MAGESTRIQSRGEHLFEFDAQFLRSILPELELKDEKLRQRYEMGRAAVADILGISLKELYSDERQPLTPSPYLHNQEIKKTENPKESVV